MRLEPGLDERAEDPEAPAGDQADAGWIDGAGADDRAIGSEQADDLAQALTSRLASESCAPLPKSEQLLLAPGVESPAYHFDYRLSLRSHVAAAGFSRNPSKSRTSASSSNRTSQVSLMRSTAAWR
jgi:hypothetical protein